MAEQQRPIERAGGSPPSPVGPLKGSARLRPFEGAEDVVLALLFAALSVIMIVSVIGRYLLPSVPISYADQLLPDIFVWLSILGAASAARRGSHLGMTALIDRLRHRGRQVAAVTTGVVGLIFFGALAYSGAQIVVQQLRLGSLAAFGYPAWVIAIAIPVGSVLAIVRIAQHAASVVRAERDEQSG